MRSKNKPGFGLNRKYSMNNFNYLLAEAALLLKENRLLLLRGPLFSGRSSLAKSVSQCFEPSLKVVMISFDDQMDSKNLFGSYQSSGIPGDFSWEASSFTNAISTESTLLVVKSWETANSDTQNAVIQLANDGFFVIPGNRRVEINSSSRIIGIVHDAHYKKETSFPLTLDCLPLGKAQVLARLSSCRINGINIGELYDLYDRIRLYIDSLPYSERRLTTRDFFVLCQRLDGKSLTVTDAFLDMADIFKSHLTKLDYQDEPTQEIASFLSIASNSVEFIERKRNVTLTVLDGTLTVGRTCLKFQNQNVNFPNVLPFALTRSYRVLMEKISTCVDNHEMVLLNGETGIGKTRVIQELANRLSIQLDAVNLSLDSEAVDIIGGFKPVNVGVLVKQLLGSFYLELDGSMNIKEKLMSLLVQKKYKSLLRSMSAIAEITVKNSKGDNLVIWSKLLTKTEQMLNFLSTEVTNTPFTYVVGVLIKAMNEGHWVLLDEINMGSTECLNALASVITEKLLVSHPNFRIFACMNPATDSGKKTLPFNIRALFTEFFVEPPSDHAEISEIINQYITTSKTSKLADFYLNMIQTNSRKFSLRNLCRSLLLAKDDVFKNMGHSIDMAVKLGFNDDNEDGWKLVPSFQTRLSDELQKTFVLVEGVYFPRGPNVIQDDSDYIRTASVQKYIQAISAASASGRFPILLEGETSTGKTSVIAHLAKITGHKVHRINNHEQTDIQEYIGSYSPNADNRLEFQEGVLLKAVRNGDWIILDELNLAPTEVLEALNRLLDDNHELVVPERDIRVTAHPHFRIFATQNPAGLYGGRKKLSRAFLNRFLVIQFVQPPKEELVQIVSTRCAISESASKLMVKVMSEMRMRRSSTRIFYSTGLMTLRDLFRWGNRVRISEKGNDWRQELCNQGYFLLASRCRTFEDTLRVKSILETVIKRDIDVKALYSIDSPYFPSCFREVCNRGDDFMILNDSMVLTPSLIRMIILFNEAAKVNEPILLVGETGCGKTTLTYLMSPKNLEFINCHERTDVSDLLGSVRPTSDGLFRWEDGVVIRAMKSGTVLLIDEISLANDSVLERLNSLLEPLRTILLTDSGASTNVITAIDGFQCVATMNPGGDYGKKELSKALRNRFTEIWCEFDGTEEEVLEILKVRLSKLGIAHTLREQCSHFLSKYLVEFFRAHGKYLKNKLCARDVVVASTMLSNFIKTSGLDSVEALYHTISSVIWDSLPIVCNGYHFNMIDDLITSGKKMFMSIDKTITEIQVAKFDVFSIVEESGDVRVGSFLLPRGPLPLKRPTEYNLNARSTAINALRVTRAFAANKPIMLEGMPGSGKSSLIGALACLSGNSLIRLNLSDQTEVSDLFGSDVPVTLQDGSVSFTWRDGPILKALKEGSWVLLDEMNLAPQAILEALNSCFDFRKTVYISELGRSFQINADNPARFFACQNPERMGGNRRSLPKSFLNRFVTIFTQDMNSEDIESIVYFIAKKENLEDKADMFLQIHDFCNDYISLRKANRISGAPLEYNLRDLMRMIDCSKRYDLLVSLELIYLARLEKSTDRIKYRKKIAEEVLKRKVTSRPVILLGQHGKLKIGNRLFESNFPINHKVLSSQLNIIQQLVVSIEGGLLSLLVGPKACGKESLVRFVSELYQTPLKVIKLNSETDAQDLLGSFEHVYDLNEIESCIEQVINLSQTTTLSERAKYLVEGLKSVETNSEKRTFIQLLVKEIRGSEVDSTFVEILRDITHATLSFDWVDSDFVRAYIEGHWVMIKDVNCCSAAVLDRLNNCLERDGELVLSEKIDGQFRVIKQHKNFRVFFSLRPENGNISNAMKNRAAEIRFSQQDCWTSFWIDRLRLLVPNLDLIIEKLPLLDQKDIQILNTEPVMSLKTLNVPQKAALSMLDLDLQYSDLSSSHLLDVFHSFYHTAWFIDMAEFDSNLVCFIARVVTGLNPEYSRRLLSFNSNGNMTRVWDEALALKPRSDWTIFCSDGEPTNSESEEYLISHLFSFVLCESLKPNHVNSLLTNFTNPDLQTIPGYLLTLYNQFLEHCATHKKQLNVEFLFYGYVLLKFMKSEWNKHIGDVIGLSIVYVFHRLDFNKELNSEFLQSVNKVVSLINFDQNEFHDRHVIVHPFTTSSQVEKARSKLKSLKDNSEPCLDRMRTVNMEMKTLIELFKAVLIPNFDCDFMDKFTRLLPYFHVDDGLLIKMGMVSILRTKISLGERDFAVTNVVKADALAPILSLFWEYLGFNFNVNQLKILELMSVGSVIDELSNYVYIYACLVDQVNTKSKRFLHDHCFDELNEDQQLEYVKKTRPAELIDPLLKRYATKELNLEIKRILDSIRNLLSRYGRNIFGTAEDFDLAFDTVSENCSNFSCQLHRLHHESKTELSELNDLGELIRPPNTKFFELCHLISMFVEQLESLLHFDGNINFNLLHDSINRHVDKLTSFYWEYPDIICPYISSIFELEIILLSRSELIKRSETGALLDGFQWISIPNVDNLVQRFSQTISSLPGRLQIQFIKEALFIESIRHESTRPLILDWLKTQWQGWYKSIQKKKADLFKYKTTQMKKRNDVEPTEVDENEGVDEELIEIEQMLPDFSSIEEMKFIAETNQLDIFSEEEMLSLIRTILHFDQSQNEENTGIQVSYASSECLELFAYANLETHALNLAQLKRSVEDKASECLNVYKHNKPSLLIDCVSKLMGLEKRVNELLDLFPENNLLKNIVMSIDTFVCTSSGHPQMMYTSMLETVLEKSDLWDANTCREYSLGDLLTPLKEVILSWRKMEVACWNDIIQQAQTTSHQNALLSSWPLFEAFTEFENFSDDYEKKLLVMLIQWLNDSSFNDFVARIECGEMIIAWMELARERTRILPKLHSIILYYKQFIGATGERTRPALDETTDKLRNLVKVAKYTDLNVWSVKESAKRVHNQLCRLIHAYKVELNKPANSIFLDSILPKSSSLTNAIASAEWGLVERHIAGSFVDFLRNLHVILVRSYAFQEADDLIHTVKAFLEQVKEPVDYSVNKALCEPGNKEDIKKVQNKLYSREMLKRRRTFADLRKKAISFGFNSRKGLAMQTDSLTERSMTSFKLTSDETFNSIILLCCSARNVVVRVLTGFKHHEQQHVAAQIPVETFSFMKGVVEYGQERLLALNQSIFNLESLQRELRATTEVVHGLDLNNALSFDYTEIEKAFERTAAGYRIVRRKFSTFCQLVSRDNLNISGSFLDFIPKFLKDDMAFSELQNIIRKISDILDLITLSMAEFNLTRICLLPAHFSSVYDKINDVVTLVESLEDLSGTYCNEFVNNLKQFCLLFKQFMELLNQRSVEPNELKFNDEPLLLRSQSIYRYFEKTMEKPFFTKLESLPAYLENCGLHEQIAEIAELRRLLERGYLPRNEEKLLQNLKGFSEVIDTVCDYLRKGSTLSAVFFYDFCCSAEWVFKHGFLSPIPNEENDSGDGAGETSGEPSGFGEGKGQSDVGKEMEETGQVEGLQDEGNEIGDDTEYNKNEIETPLDMDDDFAADLEDLDEQEGDDNKDDNNSGDKEEEEPDWDVGDVMDEEEKQLDPGLWDHESKPDNIDAEEQGAQEQTEETVARAEEASGKESEQEEKNEPSADETAMEDDDEMENIDDVNLDDEDDRLQNDVDDENMDVDDAGQEDQIQEEEIPTTHDDNENELEDNTCQNDIGNDEDNKKTESGQKSDSIEISGQGANENGQDDKEMEERQGLDEMLDAQEGKSTGEGYERQSKDNEIRVNREQNVTAVPMERINEDVSAEKVDEQDVVDKKEGESSDETQKTFAEKSETDPDSKAYYVQKSATVDKSRETIIDNVQENQRLKESRDILGETPREFNARLEQHYHIDSFYLNSTVDVGTTIRAEDAITHLKESLSGLDDSHDKTNLAKKWHFIDQSVTADAFELAEALRIVIEPTKASKFQGDYRTGKRLNMRRLIPYIASNYRKNQIWMRRTKPAKRTVHVCLAIDDSYSMKENMMTEITCQTVCLLEKAFKQLEIGKVSICKFGYDVDMLCESAEQSDMDQVGPKLLESLQFTQTKTDLQVLLTKMKEFFGFSRQFSDASHQLLVIIGDGRGTMVNGTGTVKPLVKQLVDNGVTTLYLIVDNPSSSVFSMKVANKNSGKMELSNYMDMFPFPFYSVVQNAAVIPLAISGALKQWMDALML